MTISEARDRLLSIIAKRGASHDCPVCKRHTQVYYHPLNLNMAKGVVALWQEHGTSWGDINLVRIKYNLHRSKQETTASRWGLLEEETSIRRDDGGRAGFWRVTDLGERWIMGEETVPKYALLYDSRCLGHSGEPISIHDAMGMYFNYREVMS
jgi:hypothetical protein